MYYELKTDYMLKYMFFTNKLENCFKNVFEFPNDNKLVKFLYSHISSNILSFKGSKPDTASRPPLISQSIQML